MTESLVTVAYIAASALFILSLGGLSNQETARRGNLYGIIGMLIALVVYPGVIADECDAFRSVLARLNDARVVTVGDRAGPCHGQGGSQHVDVVFDDLADPDIVIVPGGLGAERIADAYWMLHNQPRAGWTHELDIRPFVEPW